MRYRQIVTTALAVACTSCAQFSARIDDVVLERTSLVQEKWGDLTPYADSEETYTFVKFDLSSSENLALVWDGLILQSICEPRGGGIDEGVDSVTFGPFHDGQNIPSGRINDDFGDDWSANNEGRFEYVVYALPNMELNQLVEHKLVRFSVRSTSFEYVSCYFRGVTMLPLRVPKSVNWTVSRDDLLKLQEEPESQ